MNNALRSSHIDEEWEDLQKRGGRGDIMTLQIVTFTSRVVEPIVSGKEPSGHIAKDVGHTLFSLAGISCRNMLSEQ